MSGSRMARENLEMKIVALCELHQLQACLRETRGEWELFANFVCLHFDRLLRSTYARFANQLAHSNLGAVFSSPCSHACSRLFSPGERVVFVYCSTVIVDLSLNALVDG